MFIFQSAEMSETDIEKLYAVLRKAIDFSGKAFLLLKEKLTFDFEQNTPFQWNGGMDISNLFCSVIRKKIWVVAQ